jgi:hypothetical protein
VRSVDPNDGSTLLEAQIPGPNGRVEGLAVAADGTVRALSQQGRIYRVENDPATPSLLFADPFDQLAPMLGNGASTKGLVVDRAGVSYTVERSSFNNGRLWRVDPAQAGASDLGPVQDGRGLAGDPFENRLLCAEWGGAGFNGRVAEVNESSFGLLTVPGLAPLNYSNGVVLGDGDILVDSQGGIYTVCEDEFAVYRLDRDSGQRVRIASGYLNHPGGFALAPSRASTPSSTGWSLYLHDRSQLFELPGFPAPAPRNLDRSAPPIGAPVGFVDPRHGRPRCALLSPEGGAALVGTDSGRLVRVPLDGSPATLLAGPVQGLSGDLRDLAATPDGQVLAARADGAVYRIGPATGWLPTLFFADPGNLLNDVRGLAVDSAGRVFLSDRPAQYPAAGRLWRLTGGTTLVQVAFTARGTRPAIDPLTGDVFLAQEGAPNATRGEILRATATQVPALVGSDAPADQSAPRGFALGGFDGALCFDLAGHQYLAEGDLGRIVRLDRSASTTSILAGSYDRPLDLFLAPGTPGIAGPQGTSLFVLDGYALYEHGVAGQIPAVAAGPSGGAPAELRARGLALFGATTAVQIQRPAAAGAIYLLLPGLFGKEPGFPLALIGNPFDPRVVPQNFDPLLWTALSSPALPGALGVLDGAGQSPPLLGVNLPASPALQGLGAFLDLTWLQVDPFTFSGVAHIGGTSQIFLGQ